jgi:hypothetical protein
MDEEWMKEMAVNSQNGGGWVRTEGDRRWQTGFGMELTVCGKDLVVYGLWHATQCACDAVWLFVKEMPAFVYNMFINENGLNILHTNNEAYEPVPRSILNEIGIMSTCKTPLWALGASRASI